MSEIDFVPYIFTIYGTCSSFFLLWINGIASKTYTINISCTNRIQTKGGEHHSQTIAPQAAGKAFGGAAGGAAGRGNGRKLAEDPEGSAPQNADRCAGHRHGGRSRLSGRGAGERKGAGAHCQPHQPEKHHHESHYGGGKPQGGCYRVLAAGDRYRRSAADGRGRSSAGSRPVTP